MYRLVPGTEYEKPSVWHLILLLSTYLGNGSFEEDLWRGTYVSLLPRSILLRIIWPSIWFALWHHAPGAIHAGGKL